MKLRRQKIPVVVRGDHHIKYEVGYRTLPDGSVQQIHQEYEPPMILLEPDTLVIVTRAPKDEYRKHRYRSGARLLERRTRPKLGDLDGVIIEPFAPKGRPKFRKSNLFQARYPVDLTKTVYRFEGRPKKGCKKCKREQKRWFWNHWGYRQRRLSLRLLNYSDERRIGCPHHVKRVERQVQHPDAGKVFSAFSAIKLLGLEPGTDIVVRIEGEWRHAIVQQYAWWTARKETAEKRQKAEMEQATALTAQKEETRQKARQRQRRRRYLNQPTWLEALLQDRFSVEEKPIRKSSGVEQEYGRCEGDDVRGCSDGGAGQGDRQRSALEDSG